MEDIYRIFILMIIALALKIYSRMAEKFKIFSVLFMIFCLGIFIFVFRLTMIKIGSLATITFFLVFFVASSYPLLFLLLNQMVKYLVKDKVHDDTKDYIDLNKEKDYYRELLEGYNIAEICYLEDMKCNAKKDATAALLQLEMKGFIKITNLYIEVNGDMWGKKNQLSKVEQYILNHIHGGILKIRPKDFERIIKYELLEKKMLEENDKVAKKIIIAELVAFIILLATIVFFNGYIKDVLLVDTKSIVFTSKDLGNLLQGFIIPLIISFMVMYPKAIIVTYIRTESGKEIAKKAKQLKNYITEFSKLDDRSKEELIMWEDYLIYSVGFGINKKVIRETKDFIKISYLDEDVTMEYDV